jgi:hypothetical protein
MPLPPINFINNNLPLKPIMSNLRQQDSPNNPVHASSHDDADTNNTVRPIRQGLVHAVAIRRRHERRNGQVDVAEQEEHGDRESGFDWRVPLPGCFVQVEVDQGAGDEDVDDGERVGNYAGCC